MKRYIVLALAALAAFTSCKDFLVEAPRLSQSDDLTLSTANGLDQSVAGAYAPLASTAWYGADFIIINEMKTANGKKYVGSQHDSGRLNEEYQLNYSENNTSALWGYGYYVISAVNNVMDNLGNCGDEALAKNLKAECLFLRALSHFDLCRTYAQPYNYSADASHPGVPVVLHTDPTAKPARNTVKEVYDQIIADLTEAEGLIDPSYVRAGADDRAFASIYAIQALLSRVYLYAQNWEKAAEYATKVIDSGKYTMWTKDQILSPDYSSSVYWEDTRKGGEVIFEVYGHKNNSYDGYHDGISPMTTPDGYGDAGASMDLVNLYGENDVRGGLFLIDPDDPGVIWSAKYAGKGISDPQVSNVIVLRLSEMYLIRAEANQRLGKGGVQDDLKMISDNRGAVAETATLTGIYNERAKEFAWEAHLWFDLGRTGRAMTRKDVISGVVNKVEWPSYQWAMPIPLREHNVNPNLSHNEGWN